MSPLFVANIFLQCYNFLINVKFLSVRIMEEIYYPSSDGSHTVHAVIWRPQGDVCAILQIIHGMEEYCMRYAPFAEEAAKRGILVCAEDHLGHGGTACGDWGHFPENGQEYVLKDIAELTSRAKAIAPGVPYFVMGHSMGSFFCREYIARHSGFSGAIIMGTGFKDPVTLFFARLITAITGGTRGWEHKSRFISELAFGSYNKKFRPVCTGYEWLSKNAENVDAYVADEKCGFGFTCGGFMGLFNIIKMACSKSAFARVDKSLPLFIVAGEDDPVGDYGRGVKKTYEKYVKAGVKDVRLKLYSGARHEILNDDCREAAVRDALSFVCEKAGISFKEQF